MKKTAIFGIVTLLVISMFATSAFALSFGKNGKAHMLDEESDLTMAIESKDYEAFLVAAKEANNGRFVDMTENEFNDLTAHHEEMQNKHEEMQETREKIDAAIESEDYNTWKNAVLDIPFGENLLDKITEDNFEKFVKMHNARNTANAISEELGLEKRGHGMHEMNEMSSKFGKDMMQKHNTPSKEATN